MRAAIYGDCSQATVDVVACSDMIDASARPCSRRSNPLCIARADIMTALPLRPDAKDERGRGDAVSAPASRSLARQMGLVAFLVIPAVLMMYRTGMANRLDGLDLERAKAWL